MHRFLWEIPEKEKTVRHSPRHAAPLNGSNAAHGWPAKQNMNVQVLVKKRNQQHRARSSLKVGAIIATLKWLVNTERGI